MGSEDGGTRLGVTLGTTLDQEAALNAVLASQVASAASDKKAHFDDGDAGGEGDTWLSATYGKCADTLEQEATFLQKEGREPTNEEILNYIERFHLQEFLSDMVLVVAKYMPSDPFDFFLDHIQNLVGRHRTQHDLPNPQPSSPRRSMVDTLTVNATRANVSSEVQNRIARSLATMLATDDTARASGIKRLEQFGKVTSDGPTMTQEGFAKVLDSMQHILGLQLEDTKLMSACLQRWRFRANAAKGMHGQPLWPMSQEDFIAAWPTLVRAVRDRYVPIGGQLHRSLFIRRQSGPIKDKYTLGQSLGRGAFGEVFLVTHRDTNQRRVCKRVDRVAQKLSHEQLMFEVDLLRKMDHPHIIRLFEFFESDEHLDMILEPIFGGTLTRLLNGLWHDEARQLAGKRPELLTEAWVAVITSQLLGALTYAHEVVGVVHKDLKTDNVLLVGAAYSTPNEVLKQPVHAMLADFGIAEMFNSGSGGMHHSTFAVFEELPMESMHTHGYASLEKCQGKTRRSKTFRSRHIGGTPSYMSPEMFTGSFTEKCDVWSLGIILFQILTGDLPYVGANILMQGNLVCNPRRHPPWDQVSKYKWTLGVRWFCQQLLTKQESARPSASQAQHDSWLSKAAQEYCNVKPGRDEVKSLQQQHLQSHLMRMARHCVASQLNLSQLHYMNQRFKKYDISGDGRLSHVEMRQALVDVGVASDADAELIIESLDADSSGMIEYSEFVAGCLNLAKDSVREQLRIVFDVFDLDGSGTISLPELYQVLSGEGGGGEGMSLVLPDGKTAEEVMRDLDADGSNQVEYAEFEAYLLKEHQRLGQDVDAKNFAATGISLRSEHAD